MGGSIGGQEPIQGQVPQGVPHTTKSSKQDDVHDGWWYENGITVIQVVFPIIGTIIITWLGLKWKNKT